MAHGPAISSLTWQSLNAPDFDRRCQACYQAIESLIAIIEEAFVDSNVRVAESETLLELSSGGDIAVRALYGDLVWAPSSVHCIAVSTKELNLAKFKSSMPRRIDRR